MIRYILNLKPRSHIGQAQFIASDCLRVNDRVKQLRLNHVYNIVCIIRIILHRLIRGSGMALETRLQTFMYLKSTVLPSVVSSTMQY